MSADASGKVETFVTDGEPVAAFGAAENPRSENGALILEPNAAWGNPLFANLALKESDFHIRARLTLDELGDTGASFIIGGYYHYPCSRPEGNRTFRIVFDDESTTYDPYRLETDARIVYGMTECRAPWSEADKTVTAKTSDHIKAGNPFDFEAIQTGSDFIVKINGNEILKTTLREEGRIAGSGDGGWPVCFGFLPDRGVIKLHDFQAFGDVAEAFADCDDVWTMGRDGYFTYRIPSLATTPRGTLLAFAEARRSDFSQAWHWSREWNADNVHCVMKRSKDGGATWSEQRVISGSGQNYEARDPSPLVDAETGHVLLLTRGPYLMKSEDDGETWSPPWSLRHLLDDNWDMLSPGPANSGIQLRRGAHAGRLMYAVEGGENVGVIYSDDHGETWSLGWMTTGGKFHEPQLTELSDGRVLVNARNHTDNPGRLIAVSADGGNRFETRFDDRLTGVTCQTSLLSFDLPEDSNRENERLHVYCAPGEGRTRLILKTSDDDCENWTVPRLIYEGHSAYSTMTELPDGTLGIIFEKDGYRRLSFLRVDIP